MSQRVTYADLRFARSPPGKIQQEEASEGELTYENLQGAQPRDEKTPSSSEPPKGQSRRTWHVVLALVGTCAFLLATTVGFGVRYWQVSRQLQRASQVHVANSSLLERRIDAKEASLGQCQRWLHEAEEVLNSTREALGESWAAENRTRAQLEQREGKLRQANLSLARLQQEKGDLQRRLEWQLLHAASCQRIGCCPHGWMLFRWKCLHFSSDRKTWEESKNYCHWRSYQLLVLKDPWNAEDLWAAVGRMVWCKGL
ncbi:B-cell differentiation antigen CD72-like [Elgaria multicarinata webbii]|uniref:B-cell differentiation antigen CD72-like n=1 Tax=Elgaria multicarinata webbii TaxID=159646 RepID=UPI002FCCC5FF